MTRDIEVSVVVPTCNRPGELERCVNAIVGAHTSAVYELLVVNDGHTEIPPSVAGLSSVRVLVGARRGPAAARNVGIAAAHAPLVLFTDDDTIPQPGWIDAIHAAFTNSQAVGVAGQVDCPPHDSLFARAVSSRGAIGYLTCNIAYRTADLRAIGGFDESFPFAHGEDRDLHARMVTNGTVAIEPTALVIHPAHPFTIGQGVARARLLQSDWLLYTKHPQLLPGRRSVRWTPIAGMALAWKQRFARDPKLRRSPRRLARFVSLASGQLALALWITLRHRPPVAPR